MTGISVYQEHKLSHSTEYATVEMNIYQNTKSLQIVLVLVIDIY